MILRQRSDNGTLDENLYTLYDAMNPVAIVDERGEVKERYAYSAFGETTFMDSDFAKIETGSAYEWNLLLHVEFKDETGLYNYGYRYYHPGLGRWLSRDPIGERGGHNLYGFVGNSPTGWKDYLGLSVWSIDIGWGESTISTDDDNFTDAVDFSLLINIICVDGDLMILEEELHEINTPWVPDDFTAGIYRMYMDYSVKRSAFDQDCVDSEGRPGKKRTIKYRVVGEWKQEFTIGIGKVSISEWGIAISVIGIIDKLMPGKFRDN